MEIPINGIAGGNNATQFTFPDLPQIRTTPIYSVIPMLPTFCSQSFITGGALVPVSNMLTGYLSLFTNPIPSDPNGEDKVAVNGVPLLYLNAVNDHTNPSLWNEAMFAGQTVVWPKSYVTFKTPIGNTTNLVLCFLIKYGATQKIQQ